MSPKVLRNLDEYGSLKQTYLDISSEAEKEFQSKVGLLTVFHRILIDRVVDSYIAILKVSEEGALGATAKSVASDSLTKWLRVALGELHSATTEAQRLLIFYDKITEIAEKTIVDIHSRKEFLTKVRELVEEGE